MYYRTLDILMVVRLCLCEFVSVLYVCLCVYVCICVCAYVCAPLYMRTGICAYVRVCVSVLVCVVCVLLGISLVMWGKSEK